MIKCIICYQKFSETISIDTLLKPTVYCNECLSNLKKVENSCSYCSHPIGYKCCDKKIVNISLYHENSFLKNVLYQIKYLNLYNKLFLFENALIEATQQFENYVVVPVPLSTIMQNKRGFNQSYVLASFTKLPIINCLSRLDNKTQSKKSYLERINNPPMFTLKFIPKSKNILIIDDVFTTGTTLKSIVKLFPDEYNITCLTLQRTILK